MSYKEYASNPYTFHINNYYTQIIHNLLFSIFFLISQEVYLIEDLNINSDLNLKLEYYESI